MKIPQTLIDKFELVPSGTEIGNSFINNLIVYKSELLGLQDFYFMECDMSGEPSEHITIYSKGEQRYANVVPEFISEVDTVEAIGRIHSILGFFKRRDNMP